MSTTSQETNVETLAISRHPEASPNSWWRGKVAWALIGLVAFSAGWALSGKASSHQQKDAMPAAAAGGGTNTEAVTVTVEPVATRFIQRTVEAMGTLHGFEEVIISARVEGRVRKVCLDVGDMAKPGELLLEIDPTDHDLALQQSERGLQVELAKLGLTDVPTKSPNLEKLPPVLQASARLENMRIKKVRVEALWKDQATSAEELSNVRADFGIAEAEYANQVLMAKSGLATIHMKQAALAIARQQLKDTQVRVPTPFLPVPESKQGLEYVVTHRSVAEGTLVKPGTEVGRVPGEQSGSPGLSDVACHQGLTVAADAVMTR